MRLQDQDRKLQKSAARRNRPLIGRFCRGLSYRSHIVSENIRRRHMNAGQCAIMEALAWSDPRPGMRTDLRKISGGLERVDSGDPLPKTPPGDRGDKRARRAPN